MNKFDRVFSILILLQTKHIISAKMIAERFEISLRTVYRDIRTLKNAGIPIIGDPGVGYSIMDGYRIPPIMFNQGETSALLAAEKFIGKVTDQDTKAHYLNAMLKIKAVLRSSEKESLAILDQSIAISDENRWDGKTFLQDLFRSIAEKKIINIHYKKADGSSSERMLESIGCYHNYNNWYLVAYCHLKTDYRTFKVNRLVDLQVLDRGFEMEHMSLQDYIDKQDQAWKEEQQFQEIEIAFMHDIVEFAERRKHYFGYVEQTIQDNAVHMKFLNSSLEVIARWLLQFGNQAQVIAPPALQERMKSLASDLYAHYE